MNLPLIFLSPTLENTARINKEWFAKNGGGLGNGIDLQSEADNDGFDHEGFSVSNAEDRAGFTQSEYLNAPLNENLQTLYEEISESWSTVNILDINTKTTTQIIADKHKELDNLHDKLITAQLLVSDLNLEILRKKCEIQLEKAMA